MANNQTTENGDGQMMNDWLNSMQTLLKSVDHDYIQSCSISIVPEELKLSNEEAYMPRVVSMGPRFKGSREDLLLMEEVKLRCMLSLLHRAGRVGEAGRNLKECSKAIWKLDEQVRASYVADIKLKKHELAKIMLVDGCFLLELLVSKRLDLDAQLPSRLVPSGPAPEVLKDEDVLSDLMLLENQIPILVLHELSQILFPDEFKPDEFKPGPAGREQRATKINNLALSVLGYSLPVQSLEAPHILDLVNFFVNRKGESQTESGEGGGNHVVGIVDSRHPRLKLKRCAWRLQAAGVTIKLPQDTGSGLSCFSRFRKCFGGIFVWLGKKISNDDRQVDIPEEEIIRGLDFKFKFRRGKLEIGQLRITKTTKAKWRNVIAWEHHKKNWKSSSISATGDENGDENQSTVSPSGKFTSAALIFDGLICCAADVKLLKDKNIIVDHMKMGNEELEAFFRTMSFGVDHGVVVGSTSYVKMVDDLNNYSEAFCFVRNWKIFWHLFTFGLQWLLKFMKQDYNFVATLVAVLTAVQTVYTVLGYYYRKS